MNRSHRLWFALTAAVIVSGIFGYSLTRRQPVGEALPAIAEPLIVTVGYGTIENAIPAPGTLVPGNVASVLATATGEIAEFHAALGDRVEAGQLLATIDPDVGPGLAEIRSPMAGTVVEIELRAGTWINVSQTSHSLMKIADLDTLTMVAEVVDNDVARVDDAVEVYFTTLASGDRRWYGSEIRALRAPSIENGAARYPVRFTVDNLARELYPGMSTQVFFVTSTAENVLTVPLGALTFGAASDNTGRATVALVRPDGGTERREVVVGAMDRVNAEVLSGLATGDRVIAGTIMPTAEVSDSGAGRG